MRRKLWTAVLVTVVLLVAAGNLPGRLPSSWLVAGSALWAGIVERTPALWAGIVERTPALWAGIVERTPTLWAGIVAASSALWDDLIVRLPALVLALQTPAVAVGAAAFLAALAGALFTLAFVCRRSDPFKTVVREVRGGRRIAIVARRTRMAQDAVRTLLHPDRANRRRSRRRREEPSVPEELTPRNGRGQTPVTSGMRWVESS
jgi:hypothetical protein